MEQYLRYGSAQAIPGYNCSEAHLSLEQWYGQGTTRYLAGVACILYTILTEGLYIFSLLAIYKSSLLAMSCYKIMFILGFFDVVAIGVNSLLAGYYFLVGAVYCTHPDLMYISGCIGFGVWCGSSLTCLLLVLNRVLEVWRPSASRFLFNDERTWYMLLFSFFYAFLVSYYSMPVLFNSTKYSFFFDPFIFEDSGAMYYSKMHLANNLVVVVISILLYAILFSIICVGYSCNFSNFTNWQQAILFQTTVICFVTALVDLGCVYMQFFAVPTSLVISVQVCWMAAHGLPAYIYVFINKRIRKSVKKMLKMRGSSTGP